MIKHALYSKNMAQRHQLDSFLKRRHHVQWTYRAAPGSTVTAQRYKDEVFQHHIRLFRGTVGPDFIFVEDNACVHQPNLVDEFLEGEDVNCMDWPARSPDINSIEHA